MKTIIESRDCTTCTETNCFFKQNAKTDWLEIIGAQKQTFVYKKGDVIFTECEMMNGVYSIHYGAVKEVIQGSLDEEIISFSFNGMLVGYRGLGAGKNVFRSTSIALSDIELVYFPLPKFQLALHSNPMMMQS
ncbi:MAG: cyclic nucleotide-binding domain-containing protein, partial [Bacteroidales bacterium]|nr:cyclic nucleotide-binding domain-containing protein [Bacteroidales bacterium]